MSTKLKHGGPAYPFEYVNSTMNPQPSFFVDGGVINPRGAEQYAGMTMRDAFAIAALQGILSNRDMVDGMFSDDIPSVVELANDYAAAMLAAREKAE